MSVEYPIWIERDRYSGRNATRASKARAKNEIAATLEAKINSMVEANPSLVQVITYGQLAATTGIDIKTISRICFSIDCGHNGFTVTKPTK